MGLSGKQFRQCLSLGLLALSTTAAAELFIGETPKFDKIRMETQSLNIGRMASHIRIEAEHNSIDVRECQVILGNGQIEYFPSHELGKGQSDVFVLHQRITVNRISCTAYTTNLFFNTRAALKIYIEDQVIRPAPRPVPRPRPRPNPRPVPRPRPNQEVYLGQKQKQICVGEKQRLIKLGSRPQFWEINGQRANQSTSRYQGRKSDLIASYETSDLKAKCESTGRETFQVKWKLAFGDSRVYATDYTVVCKPCADQGQSQAKAQVKQARQKIKQASELVNRGKMQQAQNRVEQGINQLQKVLRSRSLDARERNLIQRELMPDLDQFQHSIVRGRDNQRLQDRIQSRFQELLQLMRGDDDGYDNDFDYDDDFDVDFGDDYDNDFGFR